MSDEDDLPVRFTSEEQLSRHYKELIGRSKPERESDIRIAYASARVAFLKRRALLAEHEHRQLELEAKAKIDDVAAARLAYGDPVAARPRGQTHGFSERAE